MGGGLEIYVMRHGMAAPAAPGGDDRDRPLSRTGINEMTLAAKGLVAAGVRFDRIFSSPYRRATETAQIVAAAQPGRLLVEPLDSLASGLTARTLFSDLTREGVQGRVLLVGHEPDMGLLAGGLIGLKKDRTLPFSPGSVARIDLESWPPDRDGLLVWLLTARLAGTLAG